MKVIIKGKPKEIATLALAVQEWRDKVCKKLYSLQIDGKEFGKITIPDKETHSPIETIQKAVGTTIRGIAEAEKEREQQ